MRDRLPKLVFLQLNELNFDVLAKYAARHDLPAFSRLMSEFRFVETFAEDTYENLEPWIQWVSAHTGKTYREHGVHRLGDITRTDHLQVFEALEGRGLRVGALSPMNAVNRLSSPAYFVPDPWTLTSSDSSGYSRRLAAMLRQTVNENSQSKITLKSAATLIESLFRTLHPRRTMRLCRNIARSGGRPWMRAMVLEQLIHMIHLHLLKARSPDVSFVFMNAGAHIQHHYLLSSSTLDPVIRNPTWYVPPSEDPIFDMLCVYDDIVGDYLALAGQGVRLILATGLTQVPYDRLKFYYRLKSHAETLRAIGVKFQAVHPRMTRDFEIIFSNEDETAEAFKLLESACLERDGRKLFSEIERRPSSLFVTLTYPEEILPADVVIHSNGRIENLGSHVVFVAVKNGMHSSKGFVYLSPEIAIGRVSSPVHVSQLFGLTMAAAA